MATYTAKKVKIQEITWAEYKALVQAGTDDPLTQYIIIDVLNEDELPTTPTASGDYVLESTVDDGIVIKKWTPGSMGDINTALNRIAGGGGDPSEILFEFLAGDIDEDGRSAGGSLMGDIVLTGVRTLGEYALYYKFRSNNGTGTFTAPDLETIENYSLGYAFYGCPGLTKVSLPVLNTVSGSQALYYAFNGCTGLTEIELGFTAITTSTSAANAFVGCSGLQTVSFPRLETISYTSAFSAWFNVNECKPRRILVPRLTNVTVNNGLSYLFAGQSATSPGQLERVDFPSLTNVQGNVLGSTTTNYAFRNQPNLTEIHFRTDMQSVIEGQTGYADKWGATNATIYFDL